MTMIAADVGATKTHLAVVKTNTECGIVHEAIYPSQQFADFVPLLRNFVHDSGVDGKDFTTLSVALPGIVKDGRAQLTNLPWTLKKQTLIDEFDLENVQFLNDFQASAAGISCLQETDKMVLHQGNTVTDGTRVVVGAGSGLGLAWAQYRQGGYTTFSTEGGHIDFAPQTALQIQLLQYLMALYPHVSYERLLSGTGLETIYAFLQQQPVTVRDDIVSATTAVPPSRHEKLTAPQIVSQADKGDQQASQAVRLFTEIYGAYIGNLALIFKPAGGIYITGGIAVKIKSWINRPAFIHALQAKGRMYHLVEKFTVTLVTNESVGVLGAIAEANRYNQERKNAPK